MTDITRAEESTCNRLLSLESKFMGQVCIYPVGILEVLVRAYDEETKVRLTKIVNDREVELTDEEIEHVLDIVISDLWILAQERKRWIKWCVDNGWTRY
jgi:hypothetical protein